MILIIFNFIYCFIYLFNNFQFGEMPHFFNTPHAFKKIGEIQSGEMQFGEMHHTPNYHLNNLLVNKIWECCITNFNFHGGVLHKKFISLIDVLI